MENKPQSVFNRLDTIEDSLAATQMQNQQILELLNKFNNEKETESNSSRSSLMSDGEALNIFANNAKKEYIWFGTKNEFAKTKQIVKILFILLSIAAVISTLLTSTAFGFYSTFTLFENIWFVLSCILFSYSNYVEKRMLDSDLKEHSGYQFVQDRNGTWRIINLKKKKFRWFVVLSYIAVVCNIIVIWFEPKGALAILATLFEIAFACLTFAFNKFYHKLIFTYREFILYTGKNLSGTKTVAILLDVVNNELIPYDEYKEQMSEYL